MDPVPHTPGVPQSTCGLAGQIPWTLVRVQAWPPRARRTLQNLPQAWLQVWALVIVVQDKDIELLFFLYPFELLELHLLWSVPQDQFALRDPTRSRCPRQHSSWDAYKYIHKYIYIYIYVHILPPMKLDATSHCNDEMIINFLGILNSTHRRKHSFRTVNKSQWCPQLTFYSMSYLLCTLPWHHSRVFPVGIKHLAWEYSAVKSLSCGVLEYFLGERKRWLSTHCLAGILSGLVLCCLVWIRLYGQLFNSFIGLKPKNKKWWHEISLVHLNHAWD